MGTPTASTIPRLHLSVPKLGSRAGTRTQNNALSERCDNLFHYPTKLVASHGVAPCFLGYEPNVTLVHLLAMNLGGVGTIANRPTP